MPTLPDVPQKTLAPTALEPLPKTSILPKVTSGFRKFVSSNIGRKILMALSGFVLSGFVLIHMLGNLQFLLGPEAINSYAHHLQTLPPVILWGFRGTLLLAIVVHFWMAMLVSRTKLGARPVAYAMERSLQATYAARTMMVGGIILLCFILFHLAHFTLRISPAPYVPASYALKTEIATIHVPDVYRMMVHGFQNVWVSIFYVLGVGALCFHLSHGVSSLFQTLGLRNEAWRNRLKWLSALYGLGVFVGFALIPLSVVLGWKI